MKKDYSAPLVRFRSIKLNENISDICWAYGTGHVGETLYWNYNSSIPGYVAFKFTDKSNCTVARTTEITVTQYGDGLTDHSAVVNAILAIMGGSAAQPFKNSPFSSSPPAST